MRGVEQVLSVARCFRGLGETKSRENTSQIVDWFLKFTSLGPGYPWCAAYLSFVGWQALSDDLGKTSMWPLTVTAGVASMHKDAKAKGVVAGPNEGVRGDIYIVWYGNLGGGRFGHCGFILKKLGPNQYLEVSGNTSAAGSREGWAVNVKKRTLKPTDRVIKWATLL